MSQDSDQHFPPDGKPRETFEGTGLDDEKLQKVHAQLARENNEPSEGFSPLPFFIVVIIFLHALWGGFYLSKYSGDFNPLIYDPEYNPFIATSAGAAKPFDPMAAGKKFYNRNCVVCHQADGRGLPGQFPPLVNSNWVQSEPERLIKVLLAGLQGPIVVNGNEYNNVMTAFGNKSDRDLAAVLTYIRQDESFQNQSTPVSEELVAQVRSEYGSRTAPWTAEELEEIHGPVGQ